MKIMLKAIHPPPTGTVANLPSRWSGRSVVRFHNPEEKSKIRSKMSATNHNPSGKYPGTGVNTGELPQR